MRAPVVSVVDVRAADRISKKLHREKRHGVNLERAPAGEGEDGAHEVWRLPGKIGPAELREAQDKAGDEHDENRRLQCVQPKIGPFPDEVDDTCRDPETIAPDP